MRSTVLILLAAAAVAQEAAVDDAEYDKLKGEYDAAVGEFYRPYREARRRGEKPALDYANHPRVEYVPRFLALARKHEGKEGALKALVMVLRIAPTPETKARAVEALLADHLESKGIRDAVGRLRYLHSEQGRRALEAIVERNPHDEARGPALFALGQLEKRTDQKRALAVFAEVKERYGDVRGLRGRTLRQAAESEIFEIERLSVGKVAPEIEGEDIDGEPMRLSDYRGKVVLLDFWGDW